jgi:hypothetical protein
MTREREKRLRLRKDVQTISRRLSEKRPKIAQAATESISKSRQREVDRLERDLLRAEGRWSTMTRRSRPSRRRSTRKRTQIRRSETRLMPGASGIGSAATRLLIETLTR